MRNALFILAALAAMAAANQFSLPELCAKAIDDQSLLKKDRDLAHACELQMEIIEDQEALEKFMAQPKNKRKNEFIRFGKRFDKRKNEFIRFGRSADEEEHMNHKRKNEFIRFGRSADKRKNEFIRFGRSAATAEEEHQDVKRKNEFIRFG